MKSLIGAIVAADKQTSVVISKYMRPFKGSPTIHVMEGEIQSAELQTLEFHPVEFYDMSISDHVHDELVLERSRRNLMALHAHQHGHAAANAEATLASMCPRDSPAISNSTASASCVQPDHGTGTTSRTSTGCYQEGFAKASAEASGPRADDGSRPKGPSCRLPTMTMLRSSQP